VKVVLKEVDLYLARISGPFLDESYEMKTCVWLDDKIGEEFTD
jgi:hypothetical protein